MALAKMKIRKDDEVIIITGKDKGKKGKVLRALPAISKVLVSGINVAKRHMKPSRFNPNGGIVAKELPIAISNVSLMDPKTGQATRVGFKILGDGKKVRVAKKSGEVIDSK